MNCGAHSKSANLQGVSRSRGGDSNAGPLHYEEPAAGDLSGSDRAPRTDFRSDLMISAGPLTTAEASSRLPRNRYAPFHRVAHEHLSQLRRTFISTERNP
jgi:hypothetical protein